MIKTAVNTILLVLLCVFIIGACVFPRFSLTRVIDMISARLNVVRAGVELVNNTLDAKYWSSDYIGILVDDVREHIDEYYVMLEQYIPYHLDTYDLYSRCTDDGGFFYGGYTEKVILGYDDEEGYELFNNNECCLLRCHLNDYNESESLEIIYDAFDDKIMAIFILIKDQRQEQVYSCVEGFSVDWLEKQRPPSSNDFRLSEVFYYMSYQ